MTRIKVTLHEDLCTFMIISCRILIRISNVSGRSCRENKYKHLMFNNFFFFENRAAYEIVLKNMVEPDRPHMPI